MNTLAKKYIFIGAKGTFKWKSEKIEPPNDKEWKITKETKGAFEIYKVRSADFIMRVTHDDGTRQETVYCPMPKNKKTTVDETWHVSSQELTEIENGFRERSVDNRAGGFSYAFTREYTFTA